MFDVSEKASQELTKVLGSDQAEGKSLIIYFQGHGCSGPVLGMALDQETEEMETIECNGIKAFIDPNLHKFLNEHGGIKVDYVEQEGQAGYTIRTAKQADGSSCDGCSCG